MCIYALPRGKFMQFTVFIFTSCTCSFGHETIYLKYVGIFKLEIMNQFWQDQVTVQIYFNQYILEFKELYLLIQRKCVDFFFNFFLLLFQYINLVECMSPSLYIYSLYSINCLVSQKYEIYGNHVVGQSSREHQLHQRKKCNNCNATYQFI